jgi:hypothetical protein
MAKQQKQKSSHNQSKFQQYLYGSLAKDVSGERFIEGALIRPATLLLSFIIFLFAMFFLVGGNMKWGGSLIIFSFILTLSSIYQSLTDEEGLFRTLNLCFKLTLFVAEVIAFNMLLMRVIS